VNVAITYVIVNIGGYWYGYALLAVITIVPVMSFVLSKRWAFGVDQRANNQGE
jgi:putative flippase GtrA